VPLKLLQLLPVVVDAGPPALRFQRLPRNPEFCGCASRSGYPTMALGESCFDHLHFASRQRGESLLRLRRARRLTG